MKSYLKQICFFLLVFSFSYHCQIQTPGSGSRDSKVTTQLETKEGTLSKARDSKEFHCPIPLTLGKVYGTSISKFDQTVILSELKILLADLCLGEFVHLLTLVHPVKGLYVDAKGYWTVEEVKADLKDPNGYFQVYYFDLEKLDIKKGSSGNLTVRDVFLAAKQVSVDFYVGSSEEVEVKFRFLENPKLERYLINPSFVKAEGKWYLLRMF
ncbi:hypothetical protein EHQ68_04705 [Leptospira congkakensis]|uniref:Lipoprotein n=1 Tax=Leptospira congkakensis TaxID=2484932 RepID=A0A4Z1AMA3_9LEPT|nr:hypothetical protein [Leptospira congkakensis]TGL90726.1 hypothetical protein EHQ69_12465 [Leptospira congkakensis]TGL91733.1 hypothetical protein EHQ68_04705 [Leptospira congkakensis]TGL98787.1 hypothetical protein EHQ70_04295 [Leptospira congkakensis]